MTNVPNPDVNTEVLNKVFVKVTSTTDALTVRLITQLHNMNLHVIENKVTRDKADYNKLPVLYLHCVITDAAPSLHQFCVFDLKTLTTNDHLLKVTFFVDYLE